MKSTSTKLVLAAFIAAGIAPFQAQAQTVSRQAEALKPAEIDKSGLLILVRSTLHALDLSNKSGNYTVLREIAAPGFAAANDAARLSLIFKRLREQNVDLSGVLVYEPQLTEMPGIDKNGFMKFAGFFPSATNQIKFAMTFAPVNGQWKIFGLSADVAPAGPAAPAPMAPPAPTTKAPKPAQ